MLLIDTLLVQNRKEKMQKLLQTGERANHYCPVVAPATEFIGETPMNATGTVALPESRSQFDCIASLDVQGRFDLA